MNIFKRFIHWLHLRLIKIDTIPVHYSSYSSVKWYSASDSMTVSKDAIHVWPASLKRELSAEAKEKISVLFTGGKDL